MGEQSVGFLELRTVLDGVGVEDWRVFEHGLDPFGILFQEYSVAIGIKRSPHHGIVAETKDEEITRRTFLEDIKGNGDLPEVLLRCDA